MISESERQLWQKLDANENHFFALHRSERVDWPEAVLLASPYPEIAIWNYAGSVNTSKENLAALITDVEQFFRERNMSPAFKINPLTLPNQLKRELASRGYELKTEATTMLYSGELRVFVKSNRTRVERVRINQIETFTITQLDGFESSRDWLPWFLETNKRNVARSDHVYYLAFHDDEPAGVMLAVYEPKDVCGIYAVATLPKFRGQGIATELFAHVIADAERAGCDHITLSTATGGPAERYFEKLGFDQAYTSSLLTKPRQ